MTVSVIVAPAGKSVVPVIVGVVSLVSVGASTVNVGAVRSMAPLSLAVAALPAASVADAATV